MCAQEDHLAVAQLLLRAGAVKDARTKSGYTPLHIACHQGHINMVRLLIEQGATVDAATSAGYTPLHQAAQQGHVLVISLLLKNKADPNALTNVSELYLIGMIFLGCILVFHKNILYLYIYAIYNFIKVGKFMDN